MAKELSERADDRFGTPDETLALFVHELRNPLAVIKGFAGALEESPKPEIVAAGAGAIKRAVRTLESLVGSLDNAAALFGGELELDREEVLVGKLVEETVRDLRSIAGGRPLEVSIEDDAVVLVDQVKIRQVLVNLITNAIKFGPPGTAIQIVIGLRHGNMRVCVIDQGPGVPVDRMDELFKKYSRLGSSKDGTGLGLYISRSIALAHGGDLQLLAMDRGCRFSLTLPIQRSAQSLRSV